MKYDNFRPPKLCKGKREWYVHWEIRNPETGRMKLFKERGGMNYKKNLRRRNEMARIIIESVNELWNEGRLSPFKSIAPRKTLVDHLWDQHEIFKYRTHGENATMKLKTVHAYKWAVQIFITWLKENKLDLIYPDEFTKKHAYQFWDDVLKEKKFSSYTLNLRKHNISRYFNEFVKREIIIRNPFMGIDSLKQVPGRHIPFTDEQMLQIDDLIKVPHFEFWMLTRFIYYLYLRGEEIIKLQIENIDMRVHAVIVYADKAKTKTQKAPYIPDVFYKLLQEMKLEQYPKKWYLFSTGLKPGPKPITRDWITTLFKLWVKKPLNLGTEYTMYAFKHTGIINAHAQGKSIKGIQLQAGHKTEKQTRGYMIKQGLIPNDEFADMK